MGILILSLRFAISSKIEVKSILSRQLSSTNSVKLSPSSIKIWGQRTIPWSWQGPLTILLFLVSPNYAISDVRGAVILPIDQKRSMLCEKGLVGQCTTTKDQQCGQIHFGDLKCQRVKDSELRSTEIEKCFATLNGSIARPSLNFLLESYIGAGEEKQWKLVFSSFSSSLPLKQRAASFKGDILDPGLAS